MPGNVDAWIGGLYTPSDRRAEPSMDVPALAAAARKAVPLVCSKPRADG